MIWPLHFWSKNKVPSHFHVAQCLELGCELGGDRFCQGHCLGMGLAMPAQSAASSENNSYKNNPKRLSYANDSVNNLAPCCFRSKNGLCEHFLLLYLPWYVYRVLLEEGIIIPPNKQGPENTPWIVLALLCPTDLLSLDDWALLYQ